MEWPQKCLQRENLNDMSMNFSASDSKIHTNSPLLLCGLDIEKHHNDLWRCSSPCKWIISCPHLWSVRTSIVGVSFVNWTNINLADHLKTSNIWPISEYFDYWWPLLLKNCISTEPAVLVLAAVDSEQPTSEQPTSEQPALLRLCYSIKWPYGN